MTDVAVRRGFVDIAEGQMHYRTCGPDNGPVLVMLHGSPLSAHSVVPLMKEMGKTFRVIAPDMLGNGDSSAPQKIPVTIPYLSDAMTRAMDGLGLREYYLYGYHTGGNLGIEAAINRPKQVKKLVIDGMGLYSPDDRAGLLNNQAPEMNPDLEGTQLLRAWALVRDGKVFWPWWNRTAQGVRGHGLPDANALHDDVVELLKSVRTYHHAYRAALGYDKIPRVKLLALPVLVSASEKDMLRSYLDKAAALVPSGRSAVTGDPFTEEGRQKTAKIYTDFLLEG